MSEVLTISQMLDEAKSFAEIESIYAEPSLFGVTGGKAVGTYIEHKFKAYLAANYEVAFNSSASGIDLPESNVDIKVT